MDINDWRGVAVITCLIAFLTIVFWAYSKKNKARFEEAANVIFEDDDEDSKPANREERSND